MAATIQAGSVTTYTGGLTAATPAVHDITGVTVAAGNNRALFVLLSGRSSTTFDAAGSQFEAPKLDGVDMTLVHKMSGGANSTHALYVALAPSVGTHTVQLRTTVHTANSFKATVFAADNVNQSTPTGTVVPYSSGSSASPQSNNCTVLAGGLAIQAAAIYLGAGTTSDGMAPGAGQTNFSNSPEVWVNHQFVHSYKADATAMSYSWNTGAPQNSQLIIPVNPAADPPTATANITTDDAVFSGSAQPGASTVVSMAVTTDDAVFNGSAGTVPGVITTAAFKNNTGSVQAGLTGLTVALLRFSDFALAGVLTGQVTNGSGILSMTTQLATPGVEYLVVTRNAAGTAIGAEKYTAV